VIIPMVVVAVIAMSTMASVQEEVQADTDQQGQKERQRSEDMHPVFKPEKQASNKQESAQDIARGAAPEATFLVWLAAHRKAPWSRRPEGEVTPISSHPMAPWLSLW
jgi:hypothetical protein